MNTLISQSLKYNYLDSFYFLWSYEPLVIILKVIIIIYHKIMIYYFKIII